MRAFVTKGRSFIPGKGNYSCLLVCLCACTCVSVAMEGVAQFCVSIPGKGVSRPRETMHLWVLAAPGTQPVLCQGSDRACEMCLCVWYLCARVWIPPCGPCSPTLSNVSLRLEGWWSAEPSPDPVLTFSLPRCDPQSDGPQKERGVVVIPNPHQVPACLPPLSL